MSAHDWFRDAFDATYLTVYHHRDETEAVRLVAALDIWLRLGGSRVLDLASGAGRFSGPLERVGARYVGLDLSRPLLDAARENGAGDLVRADMRRVPFAGASFQVVLSMFTSFGYFPTDDENRAVLSECARVLAPGGRFLVDLMNPARVRRELVASSERMAGELHVSEKRRIEGDRVVKDLVVTGPAIGRPKRYRESVRLFEPAEIASWAEPEGFLPAGAWGDYDGDAYHDRAARLLMGFTRVPARGARVP